VSEAATALRRHDDGEAAAQTRLVASDIRQVADLLGQVNPEAQTHYLRAADAFDNAATSLDQSDSQAALGYARQGGNEINYANAAMDSTQYC